MAEKPKISARVLPDGAPFLVTGREAETLSALVRHGARGVSGWDFPGGPPYRLAAYVHVLRRIGVPSNSPKETRTITRLFLAMSQMTISGNCFAVMARAPVGFEFCP